MILIQNLYKLGGIPSTTIHDDFLTIQITLRALSEVILHHHKTMKKIALYLSAGITLATVNTAVAQEADTVTMGANYANAVYFNLRTRDKVTAPVNQWHLAHTTVTRDNCLRINHMSGFEVYAYPNGDNSQFATMDTTGWKTWRKFYNDIHEHEKGAFNQQNNSANMWDFSWGVYDPNTKEVTGDSLYLLVAANPGMPTVYMKFMPIKQTVSGDFIYRIATLDGSTDKTDTLFQADGKNKSYKYTHFLNGKVTPEPDRNEWDLLFTRYPAPTVPPGGGTPVMYPTMGVESKRGARVSKVTYVSWTDYYDFWTKALTTLDSAFTPGNSMSLSKDLTKIGGDWKSFNNSTGRWTIQDQWVYVVESVRTDPGGNDTAIYFVNFTGFSGASKGQIIFNSGILSRIPGSVIKQNTIDAKVYPNPAKESIFVKLPESNLNTQAMIVDAQGKTLLSTQLTSQDNTYFQLNTQSLSAGMYILKLQDNAGNSSSFRFVKQ